MSLSVGRPTGKFPGINGSQFNEQKYFCFRAIPTGYLMALLAYLSSFRLLDFYPFEVFEGVPQEDRSSVENRYG